MFIIDSHIESLTSGLFNSVISSIKQSLDSIPNPENTSVCFLTVDSTVQCYSISSPEANPKIYVIQETKEMFAPLPTQHMMMNVSQDRERIDSLLDRLLEIHTIEANKSLPPEFVFSSALMVAKDFLSETGKTMISGGRIMAYISKVDNKGPGAYTPRDNHKNYNSEQECTMMTPGYNYYWQVGQELVKHRITVDLFACCSQPIDLPFLSPICIDTGGDVYYYKSFNE